MWPVVSQYSSNDPHLPELRRGMRGLRLTYSPGPWNCPWNSRAEIGNWTNHLPPFLTETTDEHKYHVPLLGEAASTFNQERPTF